MWITVPGLRPPRWARLLVGVPCALFLLLLCGFGTFRFLRMGEWGFAIVTLGFMMSGALMLVKVLRPIPHGRSANSTAAQEDFSIPPPIE